MMYSIKSFWNGIVIGICLTVLVVLIMLQIIPEFNKNMQLQEYMDNRPVRQTYNITVLTKDMVTLNTIITINSRAGNIKDKGEDMKYFLRTFFLKVVYADVSKQDSTTADDIITILPRFLALDCNDTINRVHISKVK